jgi:hypothetical protein
LNCSPYFFQILHPACEFQTPMRSLSYLQLLSGAAGAGTIGFAGSGGTLSVSGGFPTGAALSGFTSDTGGIAGIDHRWEPRLSFTRDVRIGRAYGKCRLRSGIILWMSFAPMSMCPRDNLVDRSISFQTHTLSARPQNET